MSQNQEDKGLIIHQICSALSNGEKERANEIIRNEYPFIPFVSDKRSYSEYQKIKVFIRDGFTDRYSGKKLIFPPVFPLIAKVFPKEFPYHPNWKGDECHFANYELSPTIDHIIPIARGGKDCESNWLCTSFILNTAKSNFTVEELNWKIHPAGNFEEWDGLLRWFIKYIEDDITLIGDKNIKKWFKPAKDALEEYENEK